MIHWIATALRSLARRLDPPPVPAPLLTLPGPQTRLAREAVAQWERAREAAIELRDTACVFDVKTGRCVLSTEFFPVSQEESS